MKARVNVRISGEAIVLLQMGDDGGLFINFLEKNGLVKYAEILKE